MRKIHIKEGEIIDVCFNNITIIRLMMDKNDSDVLLCIQYDVGQQNDSVDIDFGQKASELINRRLQLDR